MFLKNPIEAYFYAIFEPSYHELVEPDRVGVLRFGYATLATSEGFALCSAHELRLDADGRLRANPVVGDPPSVRSGAVFGLYQAACLSMLKADVVLHKARVMRLNDSGEASICALDDFERETLPALRDGSDDMRAPFFDALMRRVGYDGEAPDLIARQPCQAQRTRPAHACLL